MNTSKMLNFLLYNLILIIILFLSVCINFSYCIGEVIYAVNCGGGSHVDLYGIHYQRDPNSIGVSSDHGKNLIIRRVMPQDSILYQTERYNTDNFVYSVPIRSDGNYVLVLKFCEVWFTESNKKVFDVMLNDQHLVVNHLDIYHAAGLGVAHDEIIPFTIKKGVLAVNNEESNFHGVLNIEFVKLHLDNPKINAIYVMKGKLEDVPMLPALPSSMDSNNIYSDDDDEEEFLNPSSYESSRNKDSDRKLEKRRRPVTETKVSDPYATEDSSSMILPIVVAIAAFVPIVFCLCRL